MLDTKYGKFIDIDSFIGYCKLINVDYQKELKRLSKKNEKNKKLKYKFFDRK